jgi:hypothetical protein
MFLNFSGVKSRSVIGYLTSLKDKLMKLIEIRLMNSSLSPRGKEFWPSRKALSLSREKEQVCFGIIFHHIGGSVCIKLFLSKGP